MYEETKTVAEVTVLPKEGNVQVAYDKVGKVDGVEVFRKLHYELYSIDKKDQLIADLGPDIAAPYIAAVGW